MNKTPPHLTPRQVAERWGCSTRFVQQKIHDGELAALQLGPQLTRVPVAVIEAYEAALCPVILNEPPPASAKPSEPSTGVLNAAKLAALRRRMATGRV